MRTEITKYARTITRDTPLTETVKIVATIEELEFLIRALEQKQVKLLDTQNGKNVKINKR